MPGFVEFNLLKGPDAEDHTLYVIWSQTRDFDAWAQSDAFRKAHVKAGGAGRGIYKGPMQCKPFVK